MYGRSAVLDQGGVERVPKLGHGCDRHDNLQEAKLAREAEICYATVAMVTDYDCWHEDHDAVTVNDIIANLMQNAGNACRVVVHAVAAMPDRRECKCGSALSHAIITDRKMVPEETRKKLELLVAKYL